jgi:2-dehydro-3-deoxyphosphooctonate aldolase (KDO 8-P synthase)
MPAIVLEHATIGDPDKSGLFLIAGPCVIESADMAFAAAATLAALAGTLRLPVIFKSSYDKANRTSHRSFRGPGLEQGLELLAEVRRRFRLPVLSDVHSVAEVNRAAEVLDILQIPAFLCRQTDLVMAAAATGRPINVKKGQFLSPMEMAHVAAKVRAAGNDGVILTERGTFFGYQNLVVDMRSLAIMREFGLVVFDATHSVQSPGGAGDRSGGERRFVSTLARAAVAAGADGIFLEVHEEPDRALCDGPNAIALHDLDVLVRTLLRVRAASRAGEGEGDGSKGR